MRFKHSKYRSHPLPKLCKFLAISFDSGRLPTANLALSELRQLCSHLGIAHPLLAIEILNHFDRSAHVGCKLKDADALRDSHSSVGVPEGAGNALLAIRPM